MKITSLPILAVTLILALPQGAFAKTQQSVEVHTQADIPVVLELAIEQTGQSELRFGNIQPSATQTTVSSPVLIVIHVTSNLGTSYQVTQAISNDLQNANGDQINLVNLKFKTTASKTTGTVIATPAPVSKSSQTIFISDANGNSDTINAEYTLTIPPSQAPGDYSALLTYTVSSL